MASPPSPHPNAALLESATKGFEYLFSNDIISAKAHFTGKDDPFHLLGLGVCAFLEAALGMESGLMAEASRCLTLSEVGTRRQMKAPKSKANQRFPAGLEWEILNADAVVLLGLTHALSESYMGYLQCMYSLNNAHSKFTKLYKTVFPDGLDAYTTTTPSPSPTSSSSPSSSDSPGLSPTPATALSPSLRTSVSTSGLSIASTTTTSTHATTTSSTTGPGTPSKSFFGNPPAPRLGSGLAALPVPAPNSGAHTTGTTTPTPTPTRSFFSRWTASTTSLPATNASAAVATPAASPSAAVAVREEKVVLPEDGPVEELIISGTAFGFGLFNLVFSLLPKKIQSLVGFFGFKHDRKLALRALAVSAAKKDVHGVYAGLVLMTYYGVVLLLSGYQADEQHILKEYRAIVDSVQSRYPNGALWILNHAKILRMSGDAGAAIKVLLDGLKPERAHSFAQADTLLVFELAWTLLGEMRYQDAADMFLRITELNSWSHGTYYFLAAGCYVSLGKYDKAQELYDAIPDLIDKKKLVGKDLPTEVLIKKKLEFYKEKQRRRGGDVARYAEVIKISTAEELGVFWNLHARVNKYIAEAHIEEWSALTPHPTTSRLLSKSAPSPSSKTPSSPTPTTNAPSAPSPPDLDTPDELALRSLLLGVSHRTAGDLAAARTCLQDAHARHPSVRVSTWIGGVAMFELAVLELRGVEAREAKLRGGSTGPGGAGSAGTRGSVGAGAEVDMAGVALLVGEWDRALRGAGEKLEVALGLATGSTDLSSRLDSRIMMLKDEIAAKRERLVLV